MLPSVYLNFSHGRVLVFDSEQNVVPKRAVAVIGGVIVVLAPKIFCLNLFLHTLFLYLLSFLWIVYILRKVNRN